MHRSLRVVTPLAAVAALALTPAAASAAKAKVETLNVNTANLVVTPTDLNAPGQTAGDLYAYHGDVEQDGQKIGTVWGSHISLGVQGDREVVQGMITFRIGRSEIMAAGLAAYPLADQSGTIMAEPFRRPIIGGTGRYDGARGTLTTVRNADGTYSQRFRFRTG